MRTHIVRRRVSGLLLVALLFMQWVAAAHACLPMVAATAAMSDCEMHGGGEPSPTTVCKAHCDQSHQVVKSSPDADTMPDAAVDGLAIATIAPAWPALRSTRPVDWRATAPPGAPPLYIAFGTLRC